MTRIIVMRCSPKVGTTFPGQLLKEDPENSGLDWGHYCNFAILSLVFVNRNVSLSHDCSDVQTQSKINKKRKF